MHSRLPNEDELFLEALELTSSEGRQAFLDRRCGGDHALRHRIESLLAAHSESENFLDEPAYLPGNSAASAPGEQIGSRIDHYTLTGKLGEGGYGVVYLAEQAFPIRRQVALKVIKMGMDTRAMLARFASERQLLALLDHPSIAKIFEAGSTESGSPFYTMEFVDGSRITDFSNDHRLTTRERLALMIQVCGAVQHAHQKGIIHRDLKPSNILVTPREGRPLPKVIDFGIAKAVNQRRREETITIQGQLLGTPAYMGPEQLESDGMDVDTRTDVYSLGVILHELLTGKVPFDPLEEEGIERFRQRAASREPRKPSTLVASLSISERGALAEARKTSADALVGGLRGDLDAIVLKALSKDRGRRYQSAAALAQDLERFLRFEAIEARAPGLIYLAGKFVRRNRTFSAATVLLMMVLAVASGFLLRAWQRETEALLTAVGAADTLRIHLYCSDMQLAAQAFAAGDIGRVRNLLDQHVAYGSHRLEWRFFRQLVHGEELWSRKLEDDETVHAAGFISDDRMIAAGTDGRILVVDRHSGAVLDQFGMDGPPLKGVLVSPDGGKLILGRLRAACELWDLATRTLIYSGPIGAQRFAFHPNQPEVAIIHHPTGGEEEARVVLFDYGRHRERTEFNAFGRAVVFSEDGQKLITTTAHGRVGVWNPEDGSNLARFETGLDNIHDLRIVPGKREIVRITSCFGFDVWNYETGAKVVHRQPDSFATPHVAFNPDGNLMATSSENQTVTLWDTATWEPLRHFRGHGAGARTAHFSPDGGSLASGAGDGMLRLWPIHSEAKTNHFHHLWFTYPPFSATGNRVAGFKLSSEIEVWDARDMKRLAETKGELLPLGFVSEAAVWLWSEKSWALYEWAFETDEWKPKLTRDPAPAPGIAVAMDPSRQLLVIGSTESLTGYDLSADLEVPLEIPALPLTLRGASGEFSRDGKLLAFGISDTQFGIWEWPSGRLIRLIDYPGIPIQQVALSPDGRTVAACGHMNSAALWEVASGNLLRVFDGHMSTVYSVAFSNDGETLATSGFDMTVRFFNVATGRESGMLACEDYVDRVWLSKDNNRLITMERFQPRVWDLAAYPARGLTGGSERQKPALRTLRKASLEAVAVR